MSNRETLMIKALEKIAAECWVSLGEGHDLYKGWRDLCVERVDIARDTLSILQEINDD